LGRRIRPRGRAGLRQQQIGLRCIQILRVARVSDPNSPTVAEHSGEPVDLAEKKSQAFIVVSLGENELLLPAAVITRGDGHGLAVAGFQKFELAKIDSLADRVVDE